MADRTALLEMEAHCQRVRTGEMTDIETLASPFLKHKKGLLAFFRKNERVELSTEELLAASEALVYIGQAREAVKPLEILIEKRNARGSVKDVALARAGQIALEHGLPMDLSPIVSELGLSRRDLQSALMRLRSSRGRSDVLADLEKVLLQSKLLYQRVEWIESETLAVSHLKGALDGFMRAIGLAEELDNGISDHHLSRAVLELARFLLNSGEQRWGMAELEKAEEISERCGSRYIHVQCRLLMGEYVEEDEKAENVLKGVQKQASMMRNTRILAEAGSILGERLCRRGDAKGVDQLMNSAGMMKEIGGKMDWSETALKASLFSIRSGNPEKGISIARDVYKEIRSTRDRETISMMLCILFYGYIRTDERAKAKKLLLEIVSQYPVKQFPETFAILREAVRDVKWLREDKATSELFEEEMVYTISRDAVDEIKARAREAYPNEFGAMLRGIENITHIEPIMEGASNRSSFMFSMFSRFTQREVPGEGVVHSHPSGSARPSRADVSLFGRFPGINIIIAYPFEDDSMAAYDRMGNRVKIQIE